LRLEADGSYAAAGEILTFKLVRLDRPGFALDAAGMIGKLSTTTDVNLAGTLAYDFEKLSPKLREALGGNFIGRGKGKTPVALNGRLNPERKPGAKSTGGGLTNLNGNVRIAWDSLQSHGFEVGRGELNIAIENGVGRIHPIAATFGGGRVNVHPTIRLDLDPAELNLAKGTIVDRARLTPEACAHALGYAVPVIFKSSKAEGEVSILLGENRITLADTDTMLVRGQIVIHKAAAAPGPVIGELAKLLGAGNLAITIADETRVPVRIEKGRVHHQNFVVAFGPYTVGTSGSVGFDGTLDLVADLPIPLPALKSSPLLTKALANKRVQVPLKGTLSKPALDPKFFQTAVAKLAREAAVDVGKELLNKELDKLFSGMPGPKK
jgi:hypothetical protein